MEGGGGCGPTDRLEPDLVVTSTWRAQPTDALGLYGGEGEEEEREREEKVLSTISNAGI